MIKHGNGYYASTKDMISILIAKMPIFPFHVIPYIHVSLYSKYLSPESKTIFRTFIVYHIRTKGFERKSF